MGYPAEASMKFGRNSTTEKSVDFISRRSVPVNIDEMQKKLSQKAEKEPEHQFENLYGVSGDQKLRLNVQVKL